MPGATDSSARTTASPNASRVGRPVAVAERVRRVLRDDAHDLRAGRRPLDERRIHQRRDRRLEDRSLRARPYLEASKARSMASMPGRDDDPPAQERLVATGGREDRQPREREVDLGHDARRPDVAGPPAERRARARPDPRRSTSVRFGSTPETTARAAISSPEASTTPVARPSFEVIAATSAPVRISAPAAARSRGERRPTGRRARPARRRSRRPRRRRCPPNPSSRIAAVPADHGPTDAYRTPRQAIAARTASVSNDSATRSATAIGRIRRIVRESCLPRPRNARPSFSPVSASPMPGRLDVRRRGATEFVEELAHRADEAVEAGVRIGVRVGSGTQARRRSRDVSPERDRATRPATARRHGHPAP